jgi:predicted N-formylglutamate amidohydrolase
MRRAEAALVLSCEHGGNDVPARYRRLFRGAARALASHRGWDPGALVLARAIRRATGAPLVFTSTSRLLVECNRSLDHRSLFSEFTRDLDDEEKRRILAAYYHPHRDAVEESVRNALRASRRVLHVGVHTFTPVLGGRRRTADIGVLYDPRRAFETAVACALVDRLHAAAPGRVVKRNYPYRGWTDGLTTTLRRVFPARRYAGIELEVNQGLLGRRSSTELESAIAAAIGAVAGRSSRASRRRR